MLKKVGALWLKDGKKGKFMSGEIEINDQKIKVMVFKNQKQKDTHPDYTINMAVDDEEPQGNLPPVAEHRPAEPFTDPDSIPF